MTNRPLRLGRRKVRPLVGEPFAAEDIRLSHDADIEPRSKAKVTAIIVVALIAFYGVYMAHEWRAVTLSTRSGSSWRPRLWPSSAGVLAKPLAEAARTNKWVHKPLIP